MKSVHNFVVTPKGQRYNNTKRVGDSELILNTEIFNHEYVNREATVVSSPMVGDTEIKPGDTVIVHHNVFRRWHNICLLYTSPSPRDGLLSRMPSSA